MPKVSVIIPTYNHANYLGKAIQSVLRQTYTSFEIIVVDDGSTDDTRRVVEGFDDPRLKYIYQSNSGLPGARNTGIRQSCGEYIAFLDADDTYLPHKLSVQTAFLEANPDIGLVASGDQEVDSSGNVLKTWVPWIDFPSLTLSVLLWHCPFVVHALLLRRDALEKVNMFDDRLKRVEDWDLWLRLALNGCRMEWIRYVVCVRLRHETNMSNDARLMRDGVLAVLDKLYARDDLPQEVRTARKAVYAHGYVGNAARLYIAGDFAGAQSDIVKAVELNPQLLAGEPMKVVQQLFAWAQHPLVQDSHRFLNAVRTHFPASIVVSRRHWRKAYAMHYMSKVFESPTDSGNVRKALPRAILRDPSWLANVGVWSIATEAFLGKTVSGFLRQALGELRS